MGSRAATLVTAALLVAAVVGIAQAAFESPVGGGFGSAAQVFVVGRHGGAPVQLTHGPADHPYLTWSADGRRIAAYSDRMIEVLRRDGRHLRHLRVHDVSADSLAWSPGGAAIAFDVEYTNPRTEATDAHLVKLRLDSGHRRRLASLAVGRASWTPDGHMLVYLHGDVIGVGRPPPHDIRSVGADGRRHVGLVAHASDAFWPQLSPDGGRILFARASGPDAYAVWVANSLGRHQQQLAGGLLVIDAAWAPGGHRVLVVAAGRNRARALAVSLTGERRRLPRAIDSAPVAWSPDGGLIAWVRYGRRATHVEAIQPNGRSRRVLARLPAGVRVDRMAWSPDGGRLAFSASRPAPD